MNKADPAHRGLFCSGMTQAKLSQISNHDKSIQKMQQSGLIDKSWKVGRFNCLRQCGQERKLRSAGAAAIGGRRNRWNSATQAEIGLLDPRHRKKQAQEGDGQNHVCCPPGESCVQQE